MPEMPEVETIAREIKGRICGRTIKRVSVLWERSIAQPSAAAFTSRLKNARIEQIGRRAKYLVWHLRLADGEKSFMLLHLRMSGQIDIVKKTAARSPYDRVIIELNNGHEIRFNDVRKFGKIFLLKDHNQVTKKLGPEAIEISYEQFEARLLTKRGALKPLLLNQTFIAGLGNIYVDESLWRAGLHPKRCAESLNKNQVVALHRAIRDTLRLALKAAGTNTGDGVYPQGGYKPRIYGREGKRCLRCKGAIKRIVIAQRGTSLCSVCQS